MGIASLAAIPAARPRTTAQQFVYDALRSAILSGKLAGGTHLVQGDIATTLGVSRIPVREALLHLEADGLVRMEVHRGATVTWLSPAEIGELFRVRALLMSEAVRLVVPHLSDDDLRELQRISHSLNSRASRPRRAQLNRAFYEVLWRSLDGVRLRDMIEKLEGEAERYFPVLDAPDPGHGHFMEAFFARDGERAAAVVRHHLQDLGERAEARAHAMLAQPTTTADFKG